MQITSKSLAETSAAAVRWLQNLTPVAGGATVVGLQGDLGSGKTTFTQAVARALGVADTVTSPTFVIEKIYKISTTHQSLPTTNFSHLIHIDCYRLESGDELAHLGFADLLTDSGNLILLEWPERVASVLGDNYLKINFTFVDETTREIVWE